MVFCEICGACLGEERPNYAKEHLTLFPSHTSFLVKTLYDPLVLDNPDEWFKKHIPLMKNHQTPKLNTEKINSKTPEDEQILI